jgi:CRISPR-associated protein Cmr1
MGEIVARYKVVTPLMLGGANHAPEFRLASYVNVVRWWWRFLALGRYGTPQSASFWEAVLFGWSAEPFGRKRVSFRLDGPPDTGSVWNGPAIPGDLNRWSGINYLTAQAFREDSGRRPATYPPQPSGQGHQVATITGFKAVARVEAFDVAILRRLTSAALKREERGWALGELGDHADDRWQTAVGTLIDAMALIGLLGGLGARSRRGFGSLAIRELRNADDGTLIEPDRIITGLPATVADYGNCIGRHVGSRVPLGLPPYTAYSDLTSIEVCASRDDVAKLMNEIGWAFQIYRSWGQRPSNRQMEVLSAQIGANQHVHIKDWNGHSGDVLPAGYTKSAPSSGHWYHDRFKDDHENFYLNQPSGPRLAGNHTDHRALFGLPHNYMKNHEVGWAENNQDRAFRRRASPLLFHFHRLADETVVFVCLTAPAKFAPNNARLHVNRGTPYRNLPPADWSLLTGFAGFVRTPPAGAGGAPRGGVAFSNYQPQKISI